jgi:branched-chain amino acid transport system ATP-binding protein
MILEVKDLIFGYTSRDNVLRGVSLHIDEGELVILMGHNGAGKTTLLNTIFGLLKTRSGHVLYKGKELGTLASRVKAGISYCLQGQGIFPSMTVMENLDLATMSLVMDTSQHQERLKNVFDLFPILSKRKGQRAGTLSGGEQRMLSLGMALMQSPSLLLLDEPSLGLSPMLIEQLFGVIKSSFISFGMCILLVEQNVKNAIRLADRIYILKTGEVVFSGKPDILHDQTELWKKL